MKFIITVLFSIFLFSLPVFSQTKASPKPVANIQIIKSSPAYAELLLRKTELTAQAEDLQANYTDEYPKLQEARHEISLINKELEKLLAVNSAEASKLSLALGKLMLRKVELETDLWALLQQYNAEHPDVKSAKRKLDPFEKAIKEILQ